MRRFSKIGRNLFPNQISFTLLLSSLCLLSCQSAAWKQRAAKVVFTSLISSPGDEYSLHYSSCEARPSVSHNVSALLKNPHRMLPRSGSISCCNANHFMSATKGLIFLQVLSSSYLSISASLLFLSSFSLEIHFSFWLKAKLKSVILQLTRKQRVVEIVSYRDSRRDKIM